MAKVNFNELSGLKKVKARQQVVDQLSEVVTNPGIMAFLMTNFEQDKETGEYKWKANIHALCSQIEQIAKFPFFEEPFDNETLFLRGENSDYSASKNPQTTSFNFSECFKKQRAFLYLT